jgi:hypothetical protein
MTSWMPGEPEVRQVMDAHGLLPEDALFAQAMDVLAMYSDSIGAALAKASSAEDKVKTALAMLEEILMQEGIIPDNQEKQFLLPKQRKI